MKQLIKLYLITTIVLIILFGSHLYLQYADGTKEIIIVGNFDGKSILIANDGVNNIVKIQNEEYYDSEIKTYKNGGFSLKNKESQFMGIWAHPTENGLYKITLLQNGEFHRLMGIEKFDSLNDHTPTSSLGSDITKWNIPGDNTRTLPTGVGKTPEIYIKLDRIKQVVTDDGYNPDIELLSKYFNEVIPDARMELEITKNGTKIFSYNGYTNTFGKWNPEIDMDNFHYLHGKCLDVKIRATNGNLTDTFYDDFTIVSTGKRQTNPSIEVYTTERDDVFETPERIDVKCNNRVLGK
jgi:hypothetical protein